MNSCVQGIITYDLDFKNIATAGGLKYAQEKKKK
jgi:hypothetical protein